MQRPLYTHYRPKSEPNQTYTNVFYPGVEVKVGFLEPNLRRTPLGTGNAIIGGDAYYRKGYPTVRRRQIALVNINLNTTQRTEFEQFCDRNDIQEVNPYSNAIEPASGPNRGRPFSPNLGTPAGLSPFYALGFPATPETAEFHNLQIAVTSSGEFINLGIGYTPNYYPTTQCGDLLVLTFDFTYYLEQVSQNPTLVPKLNPPPPVDYRDLPIITDLRTDLLVTDTLTLHEVVNPWPQYAPVNATEPINIALIVPDDLNDMMTRALDVNYDGRVTRMILNTDDDYSLLKIVEPLGYQPKPGILTREAWQYTGLLYYELLEPPLYEFRYTLDMVKFLNLIKEHFGLPNEV